MGAEYLFIQDKDGEEEFDAAGDPTYAAGQPAAIIVGGGVGLCLGGVDDKFIGLLGNDSVKDKDIGKVTIWRGNVKAKLFDNSSNFTNIEPSGTTQSGVTGDGFPFDESVSYTRGDFLFVSATGLWTSIQPGGSGDAPAANSVPHGQVLKAPTSPTDFMTAIFWPAPSHNFHP